MVISLHAEDGWNWPDESIPNVVEETKTPQQSFTNELESLEQVSLLQEKLAEKEKTEVQLIEEKNKLLKIVKEYNDSLTNERDSLKAKIIDQDETIKVWYDNNNYFSRNNDVVVIHVIFYIY